MICSLPARSRNGEQQQQHTEGECKSSQGNSRVRTNHRYTVKPVIRVLLIKSGGREGRDCEGLSERNMAGGREWGGVSAHAYRVLIDTPRMYIEYVASLSMRTDYIRTKTLE